MKEETCLVSLTKQELDHLINDTIAQIWYIKDCVFGKERSSFGTDLKEEGPITIDEKDRLTQFGYFSRKELLDKLKQIEKDNFAETICKSE